ncbi:hypothetical protein [Streptomyces sp. BK79]|uniref:hypothetical protein n=1 Tax=Streptomyces sp. BK79 TaxID=3350097 RepID=UPI00376FA19B
MAVERRPVRVRQFAQYLTDLLTRVDQGGGWCGVFWQRDPDGMRACLDGREVPPWDVVEALLQDYAGRYGAPAAAGEADRARALHAAAVTAHDSLPGARDALGDRLDVMLREQRYAAERQAELSRLLSSAATPGAVGPGTADALRLDLAWARDDHARATARCAEIRARMAELDAVPDGPAAPPTAVSPTPAGPGAPLPDAPVPPVRRPHPARPDDSAPPAPAPHAPTPAAPRTPEPAPAAPKPRRRRRGSARFAGVLEEDPAPVADAPGHAPPPLAAPPAERTPRGARFAGAAETGAEQRATRHEPSAAEPTGTEPSAPKPWGSEQVGTADREAVDRLVEALARLRAAGRSGEAHALLAEAAHGPAARFPLLAARLERAGLGADWTTLLWESASLPAERLVAAADALTAAGRGADGERILRQGVVRPAPEIGAAVLGLVAHDRHREARAILDACVRARTPQDAARSAEPAPPVLVPLLLEAAHGVSEERHWDLLHALRVAGLTA